MTLQFKIQIKGITKPPVWRKVAVPANFTFLEFHDVVQVAFAWENYHMFEFSDKEYQSKVRISMPLKDDFFEEAKDASKIKLSDIFTTKGQKFFYVYDFGDNWLHEIILEAITDDEQKNSVCISGKGACPPEDCGGIYGYGEIKETFETMPNSEQADEYRDWLGLDEGEIWDVNSFNLDEINACLKDI